MIGTMESFSDRLTAHMKSIGWGPYDLWLQFKNKPKEERLSEQYIYRLCRGDNTPSREDVLEKLASIEALGLTLATLKAWVLLDGASYEERAVMLRELISDEELLPLVRQVVKEKKG